MLRPQHIDRLFVYFAGCHENRFRANHLRQLDVPGGSPDEVGPPQVRLQRGQGASEALSTRKPVVIRDATRDRRVNAEARLLLSIGSVAYVPLVGAGKSFGLLILTTREPHAWGRSQIRLATSTANIEMQTLSKTPTPAQAPMPPAAVSGSIMLIISAIAARMLKRQLAI